MSRLKPLCRLRGAESRRGTANTDRSETAQLRRDIRVALTASDLSEMRHDDR